MGHGAHILLISYPAQGHINPTLKFAERLIQLGAKVTYATTVSAQRHIAKTTGANTAGLTFAFFSDGHDDGFKSKSLDDFRLYKSELQSKSCEKLNEIITSSADEGQPITCLVYALLFHWAVEMAKCHNIPFALLWIQPATVLDIFYYYYNGYKEEIEKTTINSSVFIELPGVPQMGSRDLPSFLLPTCPPQYKSFFSGFKEQILALDKETNPRVFVNTFEKLETEALKSIEKYKVVGIGPLIPSAFLDHLPDCSFGGDLLQKSTDYVEWLNEKPRSSVIYVSFGSMLEFPKEQMEEIAYGLLESERPFLWVIREKEEEEKEEEVYTITCIEDLNRKGMIVPWCSQVEVLSHPALGCFITHCGWNSTLESLVSGMPVVAFPEWIDQPTNAKLIEDVWKTGVRVRKEERTKNDKVIVDRKEVKRCIEIVMGDEEKREELRRNATKWKDLAKEAVMDGGTSDINLKAFLNEVGGAN